MEFERDIAPPPAEKQIEVEAEPRPRLRSGGMSLSEAVARVEAHRDRVQTALAIAMVARIAAELDPTGIADSPDRLIAQLPTIGLALLSYMIVLWFLAARTRDRWGFGMALGIGVLQTTYALAQIVIDQAWADPMAAWRPALIAVTHVGLAIPAFRAGGAYPPLDSKRPWILGFVTALVFVAIPWLAEPVATALGVGI